MYTINVETIGVHKMQLQHYAIDECSESMKFVFVF